MVQRASQEVTLNQGPQQGQYAQPQGGYVKPNTAAEYTHEVDSGLDRTLQGILGEVGQMAKQGHQRSLEDAYLQGVAKVGQIESEAELEGDMFTRDWAVAGYRDTLGKFAMADAEAQLALDMKTERQKTPEEFQKYLANQRTKLLPSLEGMSREQRNAAFASMAHQTRAAVKLHTTEHAKYIVELEQAAVQDSAGASVSALGAARTTMNGAAYTSAVDSAFANVHSNIFQNPKFDQKLKNKLLEDYLGNMLANDHVAVYDRIRNTTVDIGGKQVNMFQQLPMDVQEKLAGQYRETTNRNAASLNFGFNMQQGANEAAMESGTYNQTNEQAQAFIEDGIRRRAMSAESSRTYWEKHLKYQMKYQDEAQLAAMVTAGNTQGIFDKQKSVSQALDAQERLAQKAKMPLDQYAAQLFLTGTNGTQEAFTRAGKLFSNAFTQMSSPDGEVNTTNAALMQFAINSVDTAEANGHTNTAVLFKSGLPEEGRMRFERMRELMRTQQYTADGAVHKAMAMEAEESKLTQAQRASMAKANDIKDAKFLANIEPRGYLSSIGLHITSAIPGSIGKEAAGELRVRPFHGWTDNESVLQEASYRVQLAMREELGAVSLASPSASPEQRHAVALSNVAARTINSENGPFILPRGMTASKFFNIPQGVPNEVVGKAVGELMVPKDKSNRFTMVVDNGVINYTEVDQNGVTVRNDRIDPKDVGKKVTDIIDGQVKQFNTVQGTGKKVKVGEATVQYNGLNSAAVEPDLMLAFRDNLVKHEGVRSEVYADASNKLYPDRKTVQTVGVGVSSTNTHYPAHGLKEGTKIPDKAIQESFRAASNDAAYIGRTVQQQLGLGDKGFLLLSEMAYQGGAVHKQPAYKPFMEALSVRSKEDAIKAFRNTPVWKNAHAERRQHYLSLIEESLKG